MIFVVTTNLHGMWGIWAANWDSYETVMCVMQKKIPYFALCVLEVHLILRIMSENTQLMLMKDTRHLI